MKDYALRQTLGFPPAPALLFLWLALCLAGAPVLAQQQNDDQRLSAFVDRSDVSINEVITLTIRVPSQLGNSRPVLTGLDRDFVQLGVATLNSYTTVNGRVQTWTEYRASIKPRRTGSLTIPSFRVGGEATQPIVVTVDEAPQLSDSGYRDIFLSTSIDKEELYVQEQLLFTVKLYYDVGFNQGAQLTTPQVENSVVQQLGSDETYQEMVDGIRYNVVERKFVIFPQGSGELAIPPVYFNATIGGRGLSSLLRTQSGRQINLASETHQVTVKSKPASFPGQTWLPAARLAISESWSGATEELSVGESLTRNIVIRAEGLSSSLLPGITYENIPGLKFYPDQPERNDSADRAGVTGSRAEGTAIVPSEPGEYLMPEIRLPWWNTQTDSLEFATIPAHTLTVLPAASSMQSSPPAFELPAAQPRGGAGAPIAPAAGANWAWISATVFFAAAWLLTLALWLRNRRQLAFAGAHLPQARVDVRAPGELPGLDAAFQGLRQACERQDLKAMRQCVLAWGQAYFGNRGIRTLEHLKAYCGNPTLEALLFNLDQALYGGDEAQAEFRCAQLFKEVSGIHESGRREQKRRKDYRLPPLYRN